MTDFIDYCAYIDTDSEYFQIFQWLIDNGIDIDKWNNLSQDEQIKYIQRVAQEVEDYVNQKSFEITQKQHYNSQVDDFKITFEQEKITFSALFSTKKRYATWTLLDGGKWKDSMSITGLEIIRSDSPELVKPKIKQILEMLLKDYSDDEIKKYIKRCKKELKQCNPLEIAENKGINKLDKYSLDNYFYKKGTPHQIKGVINFKFLLNKFQLESEYEVPKNGDKAKVVYLQKNPFKIESLSFLTWPKEFDNIGISVDVGKMIENNFVKKVRGLLEVVNKQDLLNENIGIDSFFK